MQAFSAEEEDGLAGDLAEQAPEDAAAARERLAAHMEVRHCCTGLPCQVDEIVSTSAGHQYVVLQLCAMILKGKA